MVTLKDIAREAGVSVMTVSRVVNGQLSKVSEENIKKFRRLLKSVICTQLNRQILLRRLPILYL